MTVYEVCMAHRALVAHFTSDYDYFQYNGKTRPISEQAFRKNRYMYHYKEIAKLSKPVDFMAGNMIFNPDASYIGNFTDEFYNMFVLYSTNGAYQFKNELRELKSDFNSNFNIDSETGIPYIIKLTLDKKISFFTLCVFESLLGMNERWMLQDNYLLFGKLARKASKSFPFLNIENDKYKVMVKQLYNP